MSKFTDKVTIELQILKDKGAKISQYDIDCCKTGMFAHVPSLVGKLDDDEFNLDPICKLIRDHMDTKFPETFVDIE